MRAPVADTEDKVGRLRGLSYLNADPDLLSLLAAELALDQLEDGGWGQRPGMKSDAYATGTSLAALHHAGVPAADPVYQRGLHYLLQTQLENGSWHVVSRSRPIQTYFESGFPHGKDQFISIAATCWATTALMLGK
jgi:N-acyl-D-amino-acid deacylase